MLQGRKAVLWIVVVGIASVVALFLGFSFFRHYQLRPIVLNGAVIKEDSDPIKQAPIMDVEISEANGLYRPAPNPTSCGYFLRYLFCGASARTRSVTLRFLHPDYVPVDLTELVSDKLTIIHLVPIHRDTDRRDRATRSSSDCHRQHRRIRYSTETTTQENIGTGVKTFQVPNVGNVPCQNTAPCSPDGLWKAAINSESLDAGEGKRFPKCQSFLYCGSLPFYENRV